MGGEQRQALVSESVRVLHSALNRHLREKLDALKLHPNAWRILLTLAEKGERCALGRRVPGERWADLSPTERADSEALFLFQGFDDVPGLRQSHITYVTHVEESVVARTVASLEGRRFVRRRRDPGDGRAVRVLLTARGEEAVARIRDAQRETDRVLTGRMPKREVRLLRALLDDALLSLPRGDASWARSTALLKGRQEDDA